jgi:hypothetical protein
MTYARFWTGWPTKIDIESDESERGRREGDTGERVGEDIGVVDRSIKSGSLSPLTALAAGVGTFFGPFSWACPCV